MHRGGGSTGVGAQGHGHRPKALAIACLSSGRIQQVLVTRSSKPSHSMFIQRLNARKTYNLVCTSASDFEVWMAHLSGVAVKAGRAYAGNRQDAWEIQRWYPMTGWAPSVLPHRCAFKFVHDFELLDRWLAQIGYSAALWGQGAFDCGWRGLGRHCPPPPSLGEHQTKDPFQD